MKNLTWEVYVEIFIPEGDGVKKEKNVGKHIHIEEKSWSLGCVLGSLEKEVTVLMRLPVTACMQDYTFNELVKHRCEVLPQRAVLKTSICENLCFSLFLCPEQSDAKQ